MPTVLITGAGRGIGLELTRQYLADGWHVIACLRSIASPGDLLKLEGQLTLQQLDVNNAASVKAAGEALRGTAIDVLLNNAGVIGQRDAKIGHMDYEIWADCLDTNVMGPMRLVEAFREHLLAGEKKVIATVSSRMGSIGENHSPDAIIYRSSKAAVNMVMKCVANDLGPQGATVIVLHPGWVRTDMGGPNAAVSPEESAAGMRKVIANVKHAENGRFFNYDGTAIAW